jgi:hypothetical protein
VDDWVRRELLHAIENKLLIIPVLVSGATLPPRESLPMEVAPLLDAQALELRDHQWEADRNVLLHRLEAEGFRPLNPATDNVTVDSIPRPFPEYRGVVFEQQLAAIKTALSLVYRARNKARTLSLAMNQQAESRQRELIELRELHVSIENHLYDERALLPQEVFNVLHYLKHDLFALFNAIEFVVLNDRVGSKAKDVSTSDLEQLYEKMNQKYDQLLRLVQTYLGVA